MHTCQSPTGCLKFFPCEFVHWLSLSHLPVHFWHCILKAAFDPRGHICLISSRTVSHLPLFKALLRTLCRATGVLVVSSNLLVYLRVWRREPLPGETRLCSCRWEYTSICYSTTITSIFSLRAPKPRYRRIFHDDSASTFCVWPHAVSIFVQHRISNLSGILKYYPATKK